MPRKQLRQGVRCVVPKVASNLVSLNIRCRNIFCTKRGPEFWSFPDRIRAYLNPKPEIVVSIFFSIIAILPGIQALGINYPKPQTGIDGRQELGRASGSPA